MAVETYRYLDYSDETKFEITSEGRIQLKGYSDDLLLYTSFDGDTDADYAVGDQNATAGDTTLIENFGVFGQYVWIKNNGYIRYNENNFDNLSNEGTIRFRLRAGFNNDPGHQDFVTTSNPSIAGDTYYGFTLNVEGDTFGDTQVFLEVGDTLQDIANAIDLAINGSNASSTIGDSRVRIYSDNNGDSILITDTASGNSLLTLLGGVEDPEIPNAPSADAEILNLAQASGDSNRISLTHDTDSHLILDMYDNNGDTQVHEDLGQWNNYYDTWYAFEINFNQAVVMLFIDGDLFGVKTTGFTRSSSNTRLTLSTSNNNSYRFDELMVFKVQQHYTDYTPSTSALQQYDDSDPYVDTHFGNGFSEGEVTDMNITSHSDVSYVTKIGNTWYYYLSGAWRESDGSYAQSNSPGILETQFANLTFNASADIIIRAYFHSDGSTLVWLDDIEIVTETGAAEPAIITGTVDLSDGVDLSANYNILITTDQGSKTVDVSSGAGDSTDVSLSEIKDAIDSASVSGLDTATDDGSGHLVLQTTTTGDSASIEVGSADSNDALSIVWGYEATDTGESDVGSIVDYSDLFRYVRAKLGEPLIPAEITDEQLEDCVSDSVWHYNRWRNPKEGLLYFTLDGNQKNGYKIPGVVGGEENIIEIILHPRYPFTYYAGRTDLITNLYLQYIFQSYRTGFSEFLSDYYITITTESDINVILGTQIKWQVMNGKLFIYPEPSDMNVAIRYRSALTAAETVTNQWIKDLTVAHAKIVLGNIRSTFKSGVPGGAEMIQLNGEDLKAEGVQEKQVLLEDLKKSSEPLFLEFF